MDKINLSLADLFQRLKTQISADSTVKTKVKVLKQLEQLQNDYYNQKIQKSQLQVLIVHIVGKQIMMKALKFLVPDIEERVRQRNLEQDKVDMMSRMNGDNIAEIIPQKIQVKSVVRKHNIVFASPVANEAKSTKGIEKPRSILKRQKIGTISPLEILANVALLRSRSSSSNTN